MFRCVCPDSEGYAKPKNEKFAYFYILKDHLGNTRVVMDGEGVVMQEFAYYPFGLQIQELRYLDTTMVNPFEYSYNGKEEWGEFGLDWLNYGKRGREPLTVPWGQMDPLAEKYYEWSPYAYCFNNPMRYTDPDGREPDDDRSKPTELVKMEKAMVHFDKAKQSISEVNTSEISLSGSYWSAGVEANTGIVNAKGEVGVMKGNITGYKNKVKAEGTALYADGEINLPNDIANAKGDVAGLKVTLEVNSSGEISADGDMGVAKGQINHPGKDGEISVGFKISALKVKLGAKFDKLTNAAIEGYNGLMESGIFDTPGKREFEKRSNNK